MSRQQCGDRLLRLPIGEGSQSAPCRTDEGSSVRPLPAAPGAEPEIRVDARTPSSTADLEREALIDEAIALFSSRYGRALTREEARQILERLTAFFGLLATWNRRKYSAPIEFDHAA